MIRLRGRRVVASKGLSTILFLALIGACSGAKHSGDQKLAREGVLFADDFEDGASPGWAFDSKDAWSIREGRLHVRLPRDPQQRSLATFGSEQWGDYAVEVEVCGLRGVDKGVVVRLRGRDGIGIDLRGPGYDDVVMYRGFAKLGRASVVNRNRQWNRLRVEARGNRYRVFVNGRLEIDHRDKSDARPRGRLALAAYTGGAGECEVLYDNVVVEALR